MVGFFCLLCLKKFCQLNPNFSRAGKKLHAVARVNRNILVILELGAYRKGLADTFKDSFLYRSGGWEAVFSPRPLEEYGIFPILSGILAGGIRVTKCP